MYKKIHTAKAVSHMYSGDSAVWAIATQNTLHEWQIHHALFRSHQEVVGVMKEDPGASKKCMIAQVKAKIHSEDTAARLAHTTSLQAQEPTVREFEGHAAQIWVTAISTLPEWCFKFTLNAVTDTLPHYANLCKWMKLSSSLCQLCGEYQSLAHILNSCQKTLALRRYTSRLDDVPAVIFDCCNRHLSPEMQITADLPGQYNFPLDIATTD